MDLKDRFIEVVGWYITAFEEKHEIGFDYWIGDQIGEIAEFNSYCIHFDDLRRDIDEEVQKDVFFEWYSYNYESDIADINFVNYRTWLMNNKKNV